jgi:tetratricopeptide (TPR) repeat protein
MLANQYPNEGKQQFELGETCQTLGNLLSTVDSAQAVVVAKAGVDAMERAVALSPIEELYGIERDYGRTFLALNYRLVGDYHTAEELLKSAAEAANARHERDSTNAEFGLPWIYVNFNLAELHSETGRAPAAENELRQCLASCEQFMDRIGRETRPRLAHAQMLGCMGHVLYARRSDAQAEKYLRESIAKIDAVETSFSGTIWGRESLELRYSQLSDTLLAMNRPEDAIAAAHMATRVWSGDPDAIRRSAWTRFRLGLVLWWSGHHDEARESMRVAIHDLEQNAHHSCRQSVIRLAVAFTNCPCPELRDLAKGLELARQSSHSEDGQSLRFLGIALCRAAAWAEASDAFEQGLRKLNGGDAVDFFYLAVCNAMLNNPVAAQQWYDRAIAAYDGLLVPPLFEYPCYLPEVRAEAERICRRTG